MVTAVQEAGKLGSVREKESDDGEAGERTLVDLGVDGFADDCRLPTFPSAYISYHAGLAKAHSAGSTSPK